MNRYFHLAALRELSQITALFFEIFLNQKRLFFVYKIKNLFLISSWFWFTAPRFHEGLFFARQLLS